MLRICGNFGKIVRDTLPSSTNLQQVRWRRKPRWLPTAKSKVFKVPPRPVVPVEEQEELKRLFDNYRTQIKSIRRYLTQKYRTSNSISLDHDQQMKDFEEDFQRCMEINNKWNEEIKIMREERNARELEKDIEFAKNRILEVQRKKELKLEQSEEIVRQLKEEVKSFITAENIDEAIEKALATTVDYNFAIDLEGNKIIGRESQANEAKLNEDKISIKQ